jgi:uncharacterized protein (TIGR03083 family)
MTNNATSSLPRNAADLINRIRHEWSALLHVVENVSQEQMCAPGPGGWSVKDILAHVTEWEQFLLENQFRDCPAHEALQVDKALLEHPDFDELNAIQVERNRNRPVADVLANLHDVHSQLLAELENIPDTALTERIDTFFGTHPRALVVKWITYHHYEEHHEMIEAMLDE